VNVFLVFYSTFGKYLAIVVLVNNKMRATIENILTKRSTTAVEPLQ